MVIKKEDILKDKKFVLGYKITEEFVNENFQIKNNINDEFEYHLNNLSKVKNLVNKRSRSIYTLNNFINSYKYLLDRYVFNETPDPIKKETVCYAFGSAFALKDVKGKDLEYLKSDLLFDEKINPFMCLEVWKEVDKKITDVDKLRYRDMFEFVKDNFDVIEKVWNSDSVEDIIISETINTLNYKLFEDYKVILDPFEIKVKREFSVLNLD